MQLLSQQKITVDDQIALSRQLSVTPFTKVEVSGQLIQAFNAPRYFMMHKPAGILSATVDEVHPTALDLLANEPLNNEPLNGLHIAGRLDRATTGLLIVTDDGKWSRHLTEPQQKIPKTYLVETAYPLSPDTEQRFQQGIYFAYENVTTSPASVQRVTDTQSRLTIYEGRYHQVKRMFAAVGNRVVNLHRESMGEIHLDSQLKPGEYRPLTSIEINSLRG